MGTLGGLNYSDWTGSPDSGQPTSPSHASAPTGAHERMVVEMPPQDPEDTSIYEVVVNDEEQYSIWPANREIPLGWRVVGVRGPKRECLAHIKEVWTDMRPLSLRKRMEAVVTDADAGVCAQA